MQERLRALGNPGVRRLGVRIVADEVVHVRRELCIHPDLDERRRLPCHRIPPASVVALALLRGRLVRCQYGTASIVGTTLVVAVRVLDPAHHVPLDASWNAARGSDPAHATPTVSGWHTIQVSAHGVTKPVPYELTTTYVATQTP